MTAVAQRFARFRARAEVRAVTGRYADWVRGEGLMTNLQLSGLASLRVSGKLSRHDYRKAVRDLAAASGIPVRDFLVIAKCCLETVQWMLAESGQMPFTASDHGDDGEED